MGAPGKVPRSLNDYLKAKRRDGCPVCLLATDVREQIVAARKKKSVNRVEILDWLRTEHGTSITSEEMASHANGHHDD